MRHNYQIEIERLVASGVLGNSPDETERVTLAHRAKKGRPGFNTTPLSKQLARELQTRILTVAHDAKCHALTGKRRYCDCAPDIIDYETGMVLNRKEGQQ